MADTYCLCWLRAVANVLEGTSASAHVVLQRPVGKPSSASKEIWEGRGRREGGRMGWGESGLVGRLHPPPWIRLSLSELSAPDPILMA